MHLAHRYSVSEPILVLANTWKKENREVTGSPPQNPNPKFAPCLKTDGTTSVEVEKAITAIQLVWDST